MRKFRLNEMRVGMRAKRSKEPKPQLVFDIDYDFDDDYWARPTTRARARSLSISRGSTTYALLDIQDSRRKYISSRIDINPSMMRLLSHSRSLTCVTYWR